MRTVTVYSSTAFPRVCLVPFERNSEYVLHFGERTKLAAVEYAVDGSRYQTTEYGDSPCHAIDCETGEVVLLEIR